MTAAIEQTVTAPPKDEVEAYVNSMDVTKMPALQAAFEAAWKSTKHAETRVRYKQVYDTMKGAIAEAEQREMDEAVLP